MSDDDELIVAVAIFFFVLILIISIFSITKEDNDLTLIPGLNWMGGTGSSTAFSQYEDDGLTHMSVRLYWNTVETSRDSYSTSGLNTYKNLLSLADSFNISVNVTFWTQFQSGAEDPSWIKSKSGYTPYFKATDSDTHDEWIEWVEYMVTQLKGYNAVDSWSILNEPFYAAGGQSDFEDLMTDEVAAIKAIDTSHPVGCRFTSSYTPASGKYNNSVYDLFDWMGITIYNHPDEYSQADARTDSTVYNSKWWMYKDTISDCASRGLPVWVIEFGAAPYNAGYSSLSEEEQRIHYRDALAIFDADSVARAYFWAIRWSSPSAEDFNLWTGTRYLSAYYEMLEYVDEESPSDPPEPPIEPPPPQYYSVGVYTGNAGGNVSPYGYNSVLVGQPFTATASANTDYLFSYWTRNDSQVSTNPNYTMSDGEANRTYILRAYFTANPPEEPDDPDPPEAEYYAVNIGARTGVSTDLTGTQTILLGGTLTVNAILSNNYQFDYWLYDNTETQNGQLQFTVTETATGQHTLLPVVHYVSPPPDQPYEPASENIAVMTNAEFDKISRTLKLATQRLDFDMILKKLKRV